MAVLSEPEDHFGDSAKVHGFDLNGVIGDFLLGLAARCEDSLSRERVVAVTCVESSSILFFHFLSDDYFYSSLYKTVNRIIREIVLFCCKLTKISCSFLSFFFFFCSAKTFPNAKAFLCTKTHTIITTHSLLYSVSLWSTRGVKKKEERKIASRVMS